MAVTRLAMCVRWRTVMTDRFVKLKVEKAGCVRLMMQAMAH